MLRALRNSWRLLRMALSFARHNALFPLETLGIAPALIAWARLFARRRDPRRPGERLAAALQEMGPSFIKLGQALSTRADLLDEGVAADLGRLQDHLPAFSGAEARRIVEGELGQPIEALFTSFDDLPVAAASIAQVHFAVTTDGREAAVKILRPGVEAKFRRDIDLMYWLAEWAELTMPRLRRLKPVETVKTFEDSVTLEMDLRFEAAAAAELAENFLGDDNFKVPEVDWLRTGRRVLTLERVHGIPVDEIERLKEAGHDPVAILAKAAEAMFNQVFRDGFFHADMHPGNLFIGENGNLIAVDFGIMGRVDKSTRRFLGEMLLGFLSGDYRKVAEVHFAAGYVPADQSIDSFTQACRSIAEPILGRPLHEISIAKLLGQLFQVTETFAMETQPQLLLLQKSMLVAEGVGRILDPHINMWQLAQPLIEGWMRSNLGPEARIKDVVGNVVGSLERLPRLLVETEKTYSMLMGQGLKLHPDTVRSIAEVRRRGRPSSAMLAWVLALVLAVLLVMK